MRRFFVIPLALASTLLIASPSAEDKAIEKGNAVSSLLIQKLGSELKNQMQTSGPMGALHFCSQNALNLTEQIAKETGTTIKRVSIQNRNPVNAAAPEEKDVLSQWQVMLANGETLPPYKLTKRSNGQTAFYKPILINNEACLKCHGEVAGDSPLGKALKENYPDDKAIGYKMGDLRGMVRVSF